MNDTAVDRLRDDYLTLLKRIEANEREFRRLGRAVWQVQEDERRRLARELHDGIGQNLTALEKEVQSDQGRALMKQVGARREAYAPLRDKLVSAYLDISKMQI